jgi:hypothetical protein
LRAHEQTLNDGHHVIYVPVRDQGDRAKVVDMLRGRAMTDLVVGIREPGPGRLTAALAEDHRREVDASAAQP